MGLDNQAHEEQEMKNNNPNPIFVNIQIEGKILKFLFDTGCSSSCISMKAVELYNFKWRKQPSGSIKLADGSLCERIGTTNVNVRIPNNKFQNHTFEIINLNNSETFDGYFGRDLIELFEVPIILPAFLISPNQLDTIDSDEQHLFDSPKHLNPTEEDEVIAIWIKINLQSKLDANTGIREFFCTHPSSIVSLRLKDKDKVHYVTQYRIPYNLKEAVSKQVSEWLATGVIILNPTHDVEYNNPLLAVSNGSKIRVCIDPRALNENIICSHHPIPDIQELLRELCEFECFAELDLTSAFNQFSLSKESQVLTSFTWNSQSYCFKGVPFGLSCISSLFQKSMEEMMRELLPLGVYIFIDNIIIASKNRESLLELVGKVIDILNKWSLRLNADKCKFYSTNITILGHEISHQRISMDPKKKHQILNWKPPTSHKELGRFLGLINYVGKFIPNVAYYTSHLNHLLKSKFTWSEFSNNVFNQLLAHIAEKSLALNSLKRNVPLAISTDSSQFAISGVLFQPSQLGELPSAENIVSIFSKQLSETQMRWAIYKKECYAIIKSLSHFHDLVFLNPISVYCDNSSLTKVLEQHHSSITFTWKEILWRYQTSFVFINSSTNRLADLISRQSSINLISEPISVLALSVSQNDSNNDNVPNLDIMHEDTNTKLSDQEKQEIIEHEHLMGHFSAPYVYKNLLRRGYRWANMLKDIYQHIYKCPQCLYENSYASGFIASQFYISEKPMQVVQVDLINAVPSNDQGFSFVLVMLDIFSDYVILRPLKDKSAQTVAITLASIFSTFGFPQAISGDQGLEFTNNIITELCSYLNIIFHFSTPYSPTSKGRIERKNSTFNLVLRKMIRNCQKDWPQMLEIISFCINRQCSKVTQCVPFEIFFGRNYQMESNAPNAFPSFPEHNWEKHLNMMRNIIYPSVNKRTEKVRRKASQILDSSRKMADLNLFKIGSQVMLKNILRSNKMETKYYGPYVILNQLENNHFKLKDEAGNILEREVPIQHLKPIRSEEPISINNDQESVWNIDEILAHKKVNRKTFYLVKWEGFDQLEWIDEQDFISTDMLNDYNKSISRRNK